MRLPLAGRGAVTIMRIVFLCLEPSRISVPIMKLMLKALCGPLEPVINFAESIILQNRLVPIYRQLF